MKSILKLSCLYLSVATIILTSSFAFADNEASINATTARPNVEGCQDLGYCPNKLAASGLTLLSDTKALPSESTKTDSSSK